MGFDSKLEGRTEISLPFSFDSFSELPPDALRGVLWEMFSRSVAEADGPPDAFRVVLDG